jgi:hypothetical protein
MLTVLNISANIAVNIIRINVFFGGFGSSCVDQALGGEWEVKV